jgi:large subunit ribosomal protein L25
MAKQVPLKAFYRAGVGRQEARKTRASKPAFIPAIIYGSHTQPTPIKVEAREIENIFKRATSENMLVDLTLEEADGKTTNRLAFIQEIQHHPVLDNVLHLDFHEIRANEKIKVGVLIVPIGEAEGVRTGGGVLEQVLRELHVECLPKDLPDHIEVDVSSLLIGANIHVSDLKVPAGVNVLSHQEVSVFSVLAPTKEEVVAPVAADLKEPELIKKKAEDGEAETKPGEAKPAADAKAPAKAEKK